ncbi:hypothetical protein KEX41_28330 (plasmid) [Burkholderia thailandensis]|uniref:hypothetical protein n=1 Tax=Burkholderia thailandensis TaxID=57975 RepID=UPI00192DB818|nr:hypothetical protein [Burkholderia thailandensis]MBS2132097.1 hypothetical protein [Burkholderia thailandensis]QRA15209.1 hypothetical protein JMY07_30365 [Burkholderia thailandensis]
MLIGHRFSADTFEWSSTKLDDIDFSKDFGEAAFVHDLQAIIARFNAGDAKMAIAVVTADSGMATVMAIVSRPSTSSRS